MGAGNTGAGKVISAWATSGEKRLSNEDEFSNGDVSDISDVIQRVMSLALLIIDPPGPCERINL